MSAQLTLEKWLDDCIRNARSELHMTDKQILERLAFKTYQLILADLLSIPYPD